MPNTIGLVAKAAPVPAEAKRGSANGALPISTGTGMAQLIMELLTTEAFPYTAKTASEKLAVPKWSLKLVGQIQVVNLRLEFLPTFTASSIVSGSFSPTVSGKNMAKKPATTATMPIQIMGRASQMVRVNPRRSAQIPPTRAMVLQLPTARLRMMVGNNSAV
ncbi:hypothetical protein TCAL_17012 [Tigriopus californicus]|uniref:Uncharacterized protein n=1 Tax=Tigriopus californicus TaxID=6832 RepID=A0A553PHN4_TIGCA|nr:hypothetical protein TCAL_17012 [Tigriopus californicus]